jgi:hypothetical protein
MDRIAEVFGGAVEGLLVHGLNPAMFDGRSIAQGAMLGAQK